LKTIYTYELIVIRLLNDILAEEENEAKVVRFKQELAELKRRRAEVSSNVNRFRDSVDR